MRSLQKKMLEGQLILGAWLQTPARQNPQIYANTKAGDWGYDVVIVDLEHGQIDDSEMAGIFSEVRGTPTAAGARLRRSESRYASYALDMGAELIIGPMIETVEMAENLVAACMYPSLGGKGKRGCGWGPGNNNGMGLRDYVNDWNDRVAVVAQVETATAIRNIDKIMAVDGICGAIIGPFDLSLSFQAEGEGTIGDFDSNVMRSALDSYLTACLKNKKAAGFHLVNPERDRLTSLINQGYTFIPLSMDTASVMYVAKLMLEVVHDVAGTRANGVGDMRLSQTPRR
jgi:2-keto-3-deoxy-L-rhamnonate aldolase RhmA